jgi:hypothetical protein
MQLSHLILLTGALAVTAHPSGHAHLHRSAHHEKRAEPVFVKNVHQPVPQPTPVATSSAAPTPTPSSTSGNSKAVTDSSKKLQRIPFCSEGGSKKAKRVTAAEVNYLGNTGKANGCPWNSNILLVPSEIADQYKYVQNYKNVASEPYQVICGNKMGDDDKLTGMFEVAGQNTLKFTLQPGETKTVVVQPNTQAVCAFAPQKKAGDPFPKTPFGQYAGDWVETDSENKSNGGWSGADCSSLVAQHYDMDVPGCSVCSQGTCSDIFPGGRGVNAYTKGMEQLDGIGLNLNAGPYVMEIKVGYNGN